MKLFRASDGFSMIELMVVVLLMAVVLMGLFSLQDALLQQRGRILRNIMVRNQNDYARRIVMRELSSATLIQEPAVGATGNNLVGWKNLDTTNIFCCNGTCRYCEPTNTNLKINDAANCGCSSIAGITPQPLSTSRPIEWFRFCLDQTNNRLVYYTGTIPLNSLLPAAATAACGTSATEIIAGFGSGTRTPQVLQSPGAIFSRGRANWVDVNFSVNVEGAVPSTGLLETAKAESHVGIAIMSHNQTGVSW
ncbi:MAG: prepilin-type N-terminal cleavage/methylation domain-containing protein [Elusimicrobia bacterium]|nr:prepilin-type N-terminal cleavage/methylation domain-containing protein [Elusimicrobiota bacterium]